MTRVLALDLAQTMGWAAGELGRAPAYGVYRLTAGVEDEILGGDRLGQLFASCADAIADLIGVHSPDKVIVEAPLAPQAQTHARTAAQQFGLDAIVRLVCFRRKIRHRVIRFDTVRTAQLGRSNFGGSEKAKAAVMEFCHRQGWRPQTHDAADALLLLCHELGGVPRAEASAA